MELLEAFGTLAPFMLVFSTLTAFVVGALFRKGGD